MHFVRFQVLTAASMMFRVVFWDEWWWRQYAPLKRRSTIILHGSISQKTTLNIYAFCKKVSLSFTPQPFYFQGKNSVAIQ
jgi:hypothetical protein